MVVDDIYIFLGKGAENFDADKIRYCIGVAKSKLPRTDLKELHLQVERGQVQAFAFVKFKKFVIEL